MKKIIILLLGLCSLNGFANEYQNAISVSLGGIDSIDIGSLDGALTYSMLIDNSNVLRFGVSLNGRLNGDEATFDEPELSSDVSVSCVYINRYPGDMVSPYWGTGAGLTYYHRYNDTGMMFYNGIVCGLELLLPLGIEFEVHERISLFIENQLSARYRITMTESSHSSFSVTDSQIILNLGSPQLGVSIWF